MLLAVGRIAALGVACRRDRKVLGGNAGKDKAQFWREPSVVGPSYPLAPIGQGLWDCTTST